MQNSSDHQITFEIVSPTQESSRLIMDWRNDPDTLTQSFHSAPKVWPDFYQEFIHEYLLDSSLPPLFALEKGKRVGFLRFRRIDDLWGQRVACCDVSINIAPSERGKGLASAILQAMLPLLRGRGIERIIAEVKPNNGASLKAFNKAGFRQVGGLQQSSRVITIEVAQLVYNLLDSASIPGANRLIGPGHPCFVIAEAGSNWRMGTPARDMTMAKALIDVAVEAGADAVKFQTYRPETTYVKNAGESDYLSNVGIKQSIIDIFADLSMPYEMLGELAEYCNKQDIFFMSSPFSVKDLQAVDPYVRIHKIASYEINHLRLLEAAAASGKPLVLSTGASNLADIAWSVNQFRSLTSAPICLMQCTAKYPAPLSALNLSVIPLLKAAFGVPVGLSDHSRDHLAGPTAAVALGANLIEKHFTLDNRLPGPDHAFAITPEELKQMVESIRSAEETRGSGVKEVLPDEQELYWYARRGLQSTRDITTGDQFIEGENFDILRPGKQKRGIHPRHIDAVAVSKATRDIRCGDGIQENDFSLS